MSLGIKRPLFAQPACPCKRELSMSVPYVSARQKPFMPVFSFPSPFRLMEST